MKADVQEYLRHFAPVGQEIIDYATNVMLIESRYIFVTTVKRQQYGYCTHCNSEFKTHILKPTEREIAELQQACCHVGMWMGSEFEKHKHGEDMECPKCKSKCKVRYSGLAHSRLRDYASFVYYEKSVLDPNIIVARAFSATRDYSESYKNVKTKITVMAHYVFEYKKGGKMIKNVYDWKSGYYGYHLGIARSVYSVIFNHGYSTKVRYSRESIKAAVQDTPFAWSGWEKYNYMDMTAYFDLFARYPVVEYFNKLNYSHLILDKLKGSYTLNTINWRGKSIYKVFRLSKEEFNTIKQQNIHITFWFLYLVKINREANYGLTFSEIKSISEKASRCEEFNSISKIVLKVSISFREAIRYTLKQINKTSYTYNSVYSFMRDWEDYIAECKILGFDLKDISIVLPANLHKAHQNTTLQIKYKEDQALNEKINAKLPQLSSYCFRFNGLFIRPAESTGELVIEGRALNHCVGRYSKDYAEGKTNILFIRRESEPEEPFYTMEVKDNKIIQTRSKGNHTPQENKHDDVIEFIQVFTTERLSKKSNRIKIQVPA